MRHITMTPTQKHDLRVVLHPYMRDINDIVAMADESLNNYCNVSSSMNRGLNRNRRDLERISRIPKNKYRDRVVMMKLLESLDQACNSICMALEHFDAPVAKIANDQKQFALVKSRQNGRSKSYNRYRHASSNYRVKAELSKIERSSPRVRKAMIKISIPSRLFGVLQSMGVVSSERTLKRVAEKLNTILLELDASRDFVLDIIDDTMYELKKMKPKAYPERDDRIQEIQALRVAIGNSFRIQYEHVFNFKKAFEQNISILEEGIRKAVDEAKQAGEQVTEEEAAQLISEIMKA